MTLVPVTPGHLCMFYDDKLPGKSMTISAGEVIAITRYLRNKLSELSMNVNNRTSSKA